MKNMNLLFGILIFIVGMLMCINPVSMLLVAIVITGIASVINGISELMAYRKISQDQVFVTVTIVKSVLTIVCGILAAVLPVYFMDAGMAMLKLVMIIMAIFFFCRAASELYIIVRLNDSEVNVKGLFLRAMFLIAAGILLCIIRAQTVGVVIIRILGILAIVAGAGLAVYSYKKKPEEVEYEDVSDKSDE
ncbi:DUF308 domain-containing protein [Treponema sp.]|uniref:DUF308 domain-containing protein n=1 Tax=Treponema sp. TaxID=166 RepID=UPI0025F0C0EC|nr:DUF308 domain-containing protein [Treponema sp.]MCR5217167.1 DUF308 domain-containing protein [Treponema sp.]